MNYDFLKNLTLVDKGRERQPKEKNPTGLTLRVFSTGEVYPSKELTDKFKLEYERKTPTSEEVKTNGIDIVYSQLWQPLADQPRMLLFGFTPKTEAKIDLFGTCRYNEDGTPKSSVLTQGIKSPDLVEYCKEFGWLTPDQTYVDLKVLQEHPINTENGIAYLPKVVQRGTRAGEQTYAKREGITLFPVEPTDLAQIQGNVPTIETTTELVTN